MAYQVQNLSQTNQQTLSKIRADLAAAIEGAIAETDYLKNSLQLFKQSIEKFSDLSLENADIVNSYKQKTSVQSYNLPGVFASSIGNVDFEKMKQDNARLLEISDELQNIKTEKDINYSIVISNTNDYINRIKQLKNANQLLENFITQVENSISQ